MESVVKMNSSELKSSVKKCVKCKVESPLSEYYKSKYGKDGLFWMCKYCAKEYNTNYHKPATCECGKVVSESYLEKHVKSKLHQNYFNRKSGAELVSAP